MEKKEIETILTIHPEYFHSHKFYDYVLKCIKEKEMTCSKEYGYIDHIYHIINMYNICLLDSGQCKIKIVFEADCFKPQIGSIITTTVEMVFPHGIFSSLYVLRFLIPYKCLESDYIYIQDVGYKHKITSEMITIGSQIKIIITNLKYDKGHFSCIADLYSKDKSDSQ